MGDPTDEQVQAGYSAIVAKYKSRLFFRLARKKLRKQGLPREPAADETSIEAAELPDVYQNPQQFTYCRGLIDRDYCTAKVHWLRCVRQGAIWSYKEERKVKYLSMNAVIRTDGPVVLAKPPRGVRKGEFG